MRQRKKILFLVVIAILLVSVPFAVFADVGGNVDYSPPSRDGNPGGGFGFDPFTMFYLGNALNLSPGAMIAIVIVFMVLKNRSGRRPSYHSQEPVAMRSEMPPVQIDQKSLDELRASDPSFSKNAFLSKVSNMFVQLQRAWSDKDWKRVRPFEHDQIFHMHNEQLNRFIEDNQTNRVEEINVMDAELESYEKDGPYEYLNAIIKARFKDYIVDDDSGKVIKGFKDHPVVMTYRWKLMRRQGTLTPDKDINVTQCPNCGANLSIGQNGICEYCGSEVTKGTYDWVLTQIQTLRQER